jgi:hypothetical protein
MNKTIKTISIVSLLLLVPSIAIAYDREWNTHFEADAGGTRDQAETMCATAKAAANVKALTDNCLYPYSTPAEHGDRIGQKETCDCVCIDSVCICTDKLDIYCRIKEKK